MQIANTSDARPGKGQYWHVMNNEAMPMIQDRINTRTFADSALSNKKIDTKVVEVDIVHEILTVDESDTIPDFTTDSQLSKGKNSYVDDQSADPIYTRYYHGMVIFI